MHMATENENLQESLMLTHQPMNPHQRHRLGQKIQRMTHTNHFIRLLRQKTKNSAIWRDNGELLRDLVIRLVTKNRCQRILLLAKVEFRRSTHQKNVRRPNFTQTTKLKQERKPAYPGNLPRWLPRRLQIICRRNRFRNKK